MENSNNPLRDNDFKELNAEIEHLVAEEGRIRELRQEKQIELREKIFINMFEPQLSEFSTGVIHGERRSVQE